MDVKIESSWKNALQEEFDKPYFAHLAQQVKTEYAQQTCYPPASKIFNAYNLCPLDKVKVVIIGQDPYHEPSQAMGLSFSVPQGVAMPPSLINIFKELQADLQLSIPAHGDLSRWAAQGVLLLNATLTVRAHYANSHRMLGWQTFTDATIRLLSEQREHLVFMLWGGFAKSKAALIDARRHCILTAAHPSPLAANRGGWFGNRHFSQCNAYLAANGMQPVNW